MPTPQALAVTTAEADALFTDLINTRALVLAISGGPDSTALMVLAARWAQAQKHAPVLTAITVDHGLRKESKREAADVARLAKKLGLTHRTVRWTGDKPKTGLPQAARHARYRLLAAAARKAGAVHVLTAHTLDDQAETVLIRLLRGSGLTGLAAMQPLSALPGGGDVLLARPFLAIPKARLIATLKAEKIPFAEDPTNRDPKFTRARLRGLMPQLAEEGLDAARLALLARRVGRADAAIEAAVDAAEASAEALEAGAYFKLPSEVRMRLLGRFVAARGDEGPVELAKLEALYAALDAAKNAGKSFRRSLAGAIVTLKGDASGGKVVIERAPARRPYSPKSKPKVLTTGPRSRAKGPKTR